jgi:enoyl-CoA hydratase/carnithine racemase
VTTVIMERPDARNAVDPATAEALVAAFEAFDRDPAAPRARGGTATSRRSSGRAYNPGTSTTSKGEE